MNDLLNLTYPFQLPALGYAYDALEPHFDARTMEIHHSKHHAAYVNNLNAAIEKHPHLHTATLGRLLRNLPSLPAEIQTAVRNNGGGHFNHAFFWQTLQPGGAAAPAGPAGAAIDAAFGSFDSFKEKFAQAAATRFGSGWAWLALDAFGKLQVLSTANQDHPAMDGLTPLVGLDVWEHAYYLKFQNRRPEYIGAFWNVLNWDVVNRFFTASR
jgi:Fe-Mn family superoxide dismutase